jgi:hypothetical protein
MFTWKSCFAKPIPAARVVRKQWVQQQHDTTGLPAPISSTQCHLQRVLQRLEGGSNGRTQQGVCIAEPVDELVQALGGLQQQNARQYHNALLLLEHPAPEGVNQLCAPGEDVMQHYAHIGIATRATSSAVRTYIT